MAQTNTVSVFVQMTTVTASGVADRPEDCSKLLLQWLRSSFCRVLFLSQCLWEQLWKSGMFNGLYSFIECFSHFTLNPVNFSTVCNCNSVGQLHLSWLLARQYQRRLI